MSGGKLLTRFASKLSSRGVVCVSGADSLRFLQSLVTADMHSICAPRASSTAVGFLDRRGRLLFGGLIHSKSQNDYLIDIASDCLPRMIKHLQSFRVRSDVAVDDVSKEFKIWQFVGLRDEELPSGVGPDPRLDTLGSRAVLPQDFNPSSELELQDECEYERLRIVKGVADGGDFETGGLPLDVGLHLINGVSFSKGCYLGQELTARSHFTGVLRKRLTTLIVKQPGDDSNRVIDEADAEDYFSNASSARLNIGDTILVDGGEKAAGKVTSAIDNIGVAVLRITDAFDESKSLRLEDGRQLLCIRHRL